MLFLPLILSAFLASTAFGAKLPSSFTKCDQKKNDFNQCLTKSVENAIRQLTKPIREVGLPSMEPLEIPELVIGAGSGPVAFQQNYNNVKVSGFTKIACIKAEVDSGAKKLTLDCIVPKLVMAFDYEFNGKILLLPISGKGPGDVTLDKLTLKPTFDLEEIEKKGDKYFKIVGHKLVLEPEKIHFRLENLFNGDKALGDNVLQVMNDNWKEVFADVKPSYEEAYGKIFTSIFDSLLGRVPIKDLW